MWDGAFVSWSLHFLGISCLRASLKLLQVYLTVTEMGGYGVGCAGSVPLFRGPWIFLDFLFEGFAGTLDCYRDVSVWGWWVGCVGMVPLFGGPWISSGFPFRGLPLKLNCYKYT